MDGRMMRCGIISSCQSAATSEIMEQRYIKYLTFTFNLQGKTQPGPVKKFFWKIRSL